MVSKHGRDKKPLVKTKAAKSVEAPKKTKEITKELKDKERISKDATKEKDKEQTK